MKYLINATTMLVALLPSIGEARIIRSERSGHLLLLYDNQRSDPIAVDMNNSGVLSIIAQAKSNKLPRDWDHLVPYFAAFDPKMYERCSATGQSTSMGRPIPGFTVGVDEDCPRR